MNTKLLNQKLFFALPLSVCWSSNPEATLWKNGTCPACLWKGAWHITRSSKGGGSKCDVNVKMLRQYPEMCLVQS